MVEDVLFRKSMCTFVLDRFCRTFWWNFDEFNNHDPDLLTEVIGSENEDETLDNSADPDYDHRLDGLDSGESKFSAYDFLWYRRTVWRDFFETVKDVGQRS